MKLCKGEILSYFPALRTLRALVYTNEGKSSSESGAEGRGAMRAHELTSWLESAVDGESGREAETPRRESMGKEESGGKGEAPYSWGREGERGIGVCLSIPHGLSQGRRENGRGDYSNEGR